MNDENEHSYFRCTLENETTRAIAVNLKTPGPTGTVAFWVPRSLCAVREEDSDSVLLEVESWFAKKEGMEL